MVATVASSIALSWRVIWEAGLGGRGGAQEHDARRHSCVFFSLPQGGKGGGKGVNGVSVVG